MEQQLLVLQVGEETIGGCLSFDRPQRFFFCQFFSTSFDDYENNSSAIFCEAKFYYHTLIGSPGNTPSQLGIAYGIARHPTSGGIYVSDYLYSRLVSYAYGAGNSTLLLGGIGMGTNRSQLFSPMDMSYDSFSNSLLIANYGAHNIVRYVFGTTTWTLVAGHMNGTAGITSTSLNGPTDVTYDAMGNLYVADAFNNRIQFFSDGGSTGTTIAGITGVNGGNATTLFMPYAVKLDDQLNIYVVDTYNHRIQKFLRY